MRTRHTLRAALTFVALTLMLSVAAQADPVTLDLGGLNFRVGFPGDTLTFQGQITNTGPVTVYLNGLDVTLASGLTADITPFLSLPDSLTSGQTTGLAALFRVTLGNLPQGVYAGTITLLGGASASSQGVLARQDFSVHVVPEPASLVLLGTGLMGLVAARRRFRRK